MVGNAIIPDETKHQDDENRKKSFSNQRKELQGSRPNVNVVVTVISPRSVKVMQFICFN